MSAGDQLKTRQQEIAKKASDPENKYHLLRHLIGPEYLYELAPQNQLATRKLPWEDGTWTNGIQIENEGTQLTIDFDKCEMTDVLSLLYFYFELNMMNPTKPCTSYKRISDRLRECLGDMLWGETMYEIRNQHA